LDALTLITPRAPEPRKTRKVSATAKLQAQIDALLTSLELSEGRTSRLTAVIADLEASNGALASIADGFSHDVDGLRSALALAQSHHVDTSTELSRALSALAKSQTALQKSTKRVKRLENDKKKALATKRRESKAYTQSLASLEARLESECRRSTSLAVEGSRLEGRLLEQSTKSKVLVKSLRAERKALQMRVQRAKASLAAVRGQLKSMSTWSAKTGHMYSMECRRLILRLCGAGCSEDSVKDIVLWCAEVFRIHVTHFTITPRTVGRIKKEGGYMSLIQIGREITMSYGMLLFSCLFIFSPNFRLIRRVY
jgi:DNA repair exonuclease SbcCD ATPase subunit